MKLSLCTAFGLTFILMGCSSSNDACEDVTLASEQIQQCQILQRQIVNAKGQPLIRTELERRYQQDCIDVRYYRDEKQQAICGNKHKTEEIKKKMNTESNNH
ncbi:hypothetical protein L3081_04605 [Colwellia sp. MSW7]|jgi:hypothetical protein|uniref:Lipoprotein n=1 Tax=Colwellia maritima TaxID=2912588 RepID=A0ABS9WXV1_9GAMM|nr:hypothetical protein [Colwellia maritima]MCI2282817.1 hypothetical protein [Colwellia maritima]